MVPNKFNIVDFGGFDLAGQYGEALPGIYDKIVDAHWNCVYIMCFGLKFGGFDIAPQYMIPEMFSDHIMLNGIISIDHNDVIIVPSIEPPPPAPVILPATFEENGTFVPPSGVDGYSPVTVNVSDEGSFQGDGREYLFDWKFGSSSCRIYVSKTGDMEWYSGFPEIDGEFLHEAANSEVVTAKSNCYTRISADSTYSAETQESVGDTVSSSIPIYARLVIAYENSGQMSPYEIGVGWNVGGSLTRWIIKADDTLVAHGNFALNGDCLYSIAPTATGAPFYLKSDFIGFATGVNRNFEYGKVTFDKVKITLQNEPVFSIDYGCVCFAKSLSQ